MIKMLVLSVALAAQCPETKLVGFDKPLDENEREVLANAKKRCGEIYPEAPCLVKFEKRGERNFWATCGKTR